MRIFYQSSGEFNSEFFLKARERHQGEALCRSSWGEIHPLSVFIFWLSSNQIHCERISKWTFLAFTLNRSKIYGLISRNKHGSQVFFFAQADSNNSLTNCAASTTNPQYSSPLPSRAVILNLTLQEKGIRFITRANSWHHLRGKLTVYYRPQCGSTNYLAGYRLVRGTTTNTPFPPSQMENNYSWNQKRGS